MDTSLQLVLENEILVIVRNFDNVRADQVVQSAFPLASLFKVGRKVIQLLLIDIRVQYFLVNFRTKVAWDASFSILDQERLVVFLEKSFAH